MHKNFIIVLLIMLIGISTSAYTKDLGKVGETYPIKEIDMLDFIQSRLRQMQQNGDLVATCAAFYLLKNSLTFFRCV